MKVLNLTDEQKAKIKEIMDQARVDAKNAATPQAKREVMQTARQKIRSDVLTQEQREKLAAMPKGGHKGMHRGGGHFGAKLDLTDDQKAKIKEIMTAAKADAAKATTPEAKKAVWQAARDKIRTTVLTEDQRKKVDEMKARHKAKTQPARMSA